MKLKILVLKALRPLITGQNFMSAIKIFRPLPANHPQMLAGCGSLL